MVSVREGSMIPKDPLLKRNEAVQLYQIGALDPITLFERLDFPNPTESAKRLFLWQNSPQQLFPDVPIEQPLQPKQGGAMGNENKGKVGSENLSVSSILGSYGAQQASPA